MAETFIFGSNFEEDLAFGHGPIAGVTLPDGSTETLNLIGIHSLLGPAYLSAADFAGADASLKIAAAIAALPSTGGVVDARSLHGAQTWSTNPFTGLSSTKPVHLYLGVGTTTVAVNTTVPLNVSISFAPGSILSTSSVTLSFAGQIIAGLYKIFAGTTAPVAAGVAACIYPQWFGAVGDGVTDDWAPIQAAVDFVVAGSVSNTLEIAPAGIVKFPASTYYITQAVSTCHYNGCPGDVGRGVPVGVINACLTLVGEGRGTTTLFSDQNVDLIQMFNWACPSAVKHMMITSSGQDAAHAAIRVRGNLTSIENNWFLSSIGVLVESTATVDTAGTKIIHNQCDWINNGGGVVNCVYVTRTGGSSLAPQGLTIADLDCFGGNLCVTADHLYKSVISDIRSNHGGAGIIQFNGANPGDIDSVAISNVVGDGTNLTVQPQEFGISTLNATNITISNFIANSYQGQALICNASSVTLSGFSFIDNVRNAAVAQPYDVYAFNSDLILKGGQIINNNGHPDKAIRVDGAGATGPSGSYDIDGVIISGTQYTGTVIHGNTGAGGGRRLNITNCELRDINTGGASSTIIVSAYLALIVTNNHIRDLGTPVNWLETQYVNTITTLAHNIVNGAENISLNGTAYGGYTDGTFNGATRITQAEFGDLTIQDGLVVGNHSTLNGGLTVGRARVQFSLDITPVTAANNTTLGTGGIVFVIAGNTPIHCIEHTGWQQGAMIYIEFSGSPTIKNGQSCGASFTPLFLAGSADYAATPGNTLTICLITPGVEFREFGRTV